MDARRSGAGLHELDGELALTTSRQGPGGGGPALMLFDTTPLGIGPRSDVLFR